jgi:hypothetical protein
MDEAKFHQYSALELILSKLQQHQKLAADHFKLYQHHSKEVAELRAVILLLDPETDHDAKFKTLQQEIEDTDISDDFIGGVKPPVKGSEWREAVIKVLNSPKKGWLKTDDILNNMGLEGHFERRQSYISAISLALHYLHKSGDVKRQDDQGKKGYLYCSKKYYASIAEEMDLPF